MSRTRTLTRWLRRTAVLAATTLALALVPAVAFAAGDAPAAPAAPQVPTAGTGGGAVSATTGVIAICAALFLAWKRGSLLLVLLGIAAGTMLSNTQFARSLSDMADGLIRAVIDAVSGIFA
ncbi:hypothetical protein OG216_46830 (plasmid) [Streptomycetaceae bacterium NBC_01309]